MNEAALKERLKTIATKKETTLNKVWKQLLLERFLARLSGSPYQDKFIFKGGLLLAQYIAINRETIDIDFLIVTLRQIAQDLTQAVALGRLTFEEALKFSNFINRQRHLIQLQKNKFWMNWTVWKEKNIGMSG